MLPYTAEQGTLADIASHRLAQSIVTGELAQGQKLNEAELAERFGMGRGPLREALRHLEGMRLVKRIPNVGARVVVLDRKTLSDLYAVREALEGMACRIAATLMTDDEIDQLRKLLDSHEKQIKKQGGKVYAQKEGDLDFHYQIARGSRNQMLMDLLGSEQYQLLRMCRYRTSRNAERTRPCTAATSPDRRGIGATRRRTGRNADAPPHSGRMAQHQRNDSQRRGGGSMSSKQGDRAGRSRGPIRWGCDPGAGCCAPFNIAGIPYTGRSRLAGPSTDVSGRTHVWGCECPRVLPSLRNAAPKNHCHSNEEAA